MANYESVIAESSHIFDNKALQLAERFFVIEDTSLLKVGSFGYNTAINSNMMRDATFLMNMHYNEFFLTSSRLNSTVYNWAKMLDYDVDLSTPAMIPAGIKLNLEDLERAATISATNGNNRELTIKRDTIFDVGGFNFLLPYDLHITLIRNSTGQVTVTAIYDFEEFNFRPSLVTTPYLKTMLTSDLGIQSVVISVNLYQIKKSEWIFTMASNDILDIGIVEVNYGRNVVNFRAMYSENKTNVDNFVNVETIFNEMRQPNTPIFAYYTYIGDDILRLTFSNRPGEFRPAFNSKIKLEVFTTDAEEANFNYSGMINIRSAVLENVQHSCTPLASSTTGGASGKSFRESKIALMQKLRTRNSITTSFDLQTYFDQVKRERLDTNSDFVAVKLRDDIIRRQFSLYILSRNTRGDIVPTNTVDLQLSMDEIENLGYSLKPGTLIVYDRIERRYRLLADDEMPEAYLKAKDSYLYAIPFLLNIDFKEFPKANFYLTNYSKTVPVAYNYLNTETPYEIIVNNFEIRRDPLYDIDSFVISTYLNTNSVDVSQVIVRAVIYKGTEPIGYADLNRVGTTSEYQLQVTTPDEFDKDGNYLIRDTFRDIESGQLITEIKLDGTYSLHFGILLRNKGNTIAKPGVFARMTDVDEFVLVSILESNENIAFAVNLTDVMYSQIRYMENTGKIRISHVPLIGALAYLNMDQNKEIMNDIHDALNVAQVVSTNLENNTTVDVKLYNTYGVSQYFDIDTVDLRLKLTMALNINTNKLLEEEIKVFIAQYIESCNITTEKRFSYSNLVRLLETNFPQIKYIKFFTINGGNIQSMKQVKYLDASLEDLPITYVPEFLNVRKTPPKAGTDTWFDFDIDITYEQ